MKKFQFLLLDAGPILKLFELGLWERFIDTCDVTIARTVAESEVLYIQEGLEKQHIEYGLRSYEQSGHIKIIDAEPHQIAAFQQKISGFEVHAGELETLAYFFSSHEDWLVSSGDHVGYQVLGFLGKGEKGISLEEILQQIGLAKSLEYWYTKKFRERWTHQGQVDAIQRET